MLDDDARRALEQEAIALVSLSTSQPLLQKRPAPTAAEAVVSAKRPLLPSTNATLMARYEDYQTPHPHRVTTTTATTSSYGVPACGGLQPLRVHEHPADERRVSMSVFVNADGKMRLLPGKGSPDHHNTKEAFDPSTLQEHLQSASPTATATTDSHISMQSLLVTLKKRKAEEATDATLSSATKLPRFRDVFDPALKERSHGPTIQMQMQAPTVSYATPAPAPSAPAATHDVSAVEESPYPPPPELKCKYRTGKCGNQRALKSCGDYHNLCNYHRLRANANQRKLDRKKKVQRGQPVPTGSSSEVNSPIAAPKLQPTQTVSAAAATLATLPTTFLVPHTATRPGSGAPFLPYLVPPSAPVGLAPTATTSSPSLLRPKPETKSC